MIQASTFLQKRASSSRFRPLTLLPRITTSLPLFARIFRRQAKAVLDELHVCHLEQFKHRLPTFALFVGTMIQQAKMRSLSTISQLLIIRSFEYATSDKSKKWGGPKLRCARGDFVESGASFKCSGELFLQVKCFGREFFEEHS